LISAAHVPDFRTLVFAVKTALFPSFTGSGPETVHLAAFGNFTGGEAGAVPFLFLNSPDDIGLFDSNNPDALFDGDLLDFSECHVCLLRVVSIYAAAAYG
jgi:hypothetical protein